MFPQVAGVRLLRTRRSPRRKNARVIKLKHISQRQDEICLQYLKSQRISNRIVTLMWDPGACSKTREPLPDRRCSGPHACMRQNYIRPKYSNEPPRTSMLNKPVGSGEGVQGFSCKYVKKKKVDGARRAMPL
jgi:hypothetical protein